MLANACFIAPMLLRQTEHLPEGVDWQNEIKLDGYRALAIELALHLKLGLFRGSLKHEETRDASVRS
jgi:hypothetical protein